MKKFKLFLLSIFCLFLFSGSIVSAQSYGLDETISEVPAYQAQANENYDETFVATKVGDMIGLVLSFIGVLFLILIIYGGISWMTAGGNEQNVEKAKTIIINAVIGLLIVIFAYTITSFIGNQFTN